MKMQIKKIGRKSFWSLLLQGLKYGTLTALRLFVLLTFVFLKSTEFLSVQWLFLLSKLLTEKEIGVKVKIENNWVTDDQFQQKFTEEELESMAKKIDWMTLQEIQDEFSVSYRQALKIRKVNNKLKERPSVYQYAT